MKQENGDILTPAARKQRLRAWLRAQTPPAGGALRALAGDAGNRQYFRLCLAGGKTAIAVYDASPAQCRRFLRRQRALAAAGVGVPAVLAAGDGMLLLQDFGDETYLQALRRRNCQPGRLYAAAFDGLIKIQHMQTRLPAYSAALLRAEMALFADWYCARHLRRPLAAGERRDFAESARRLQTAMLAQPQTPTHRDYHARNLMLVGGRRAPGVLDFQDAVCGAAAYDAVSLLRDAYIEWSVARQRQWLRAYWRRARAAGVPLPAGFDSFWQDFNVCGAQRGLKVLGIFARLVYRDNKPQFAASMAAAHRHLLSACERLPWLAGLRAIVARRAPPPA